MKTDSGLFGGGSRPSSVYPDWCLWELKAQDMGPTVTAGCWSTHWERVSGEAGDESDVKGCDGVVGGRGVVGG